MESVKVCRDNEIAWPDHGCRPYYDPAADSRQCEPRQLGRQHKKDVEADAERMIVPQFARHRHIKGVRVPNCSVSHDDNDRMFFDVEGARIQAELRSAKPSRSTKISNWEEMRKKFSARIDHDPAGRWSAD